MNCKDVETSVTNLADKLEGFVLLYKLTEWMSHCLKQKRETNNSDEYPVDEEKVMFNKILREVRNVSPDLILVDVENLKFIGLCLNDYDVGGDVKFNEFLISSILESYKSIAKNVSDELNKKSKAIKRQKWRKTWTKNFDVIKEKNIIEEYSLIKFEKKPGVEKYLKLRRDVNSLYRIDFKIEKFKRDFKGTELLPKEESLALQRVFHIIGEYLKSGVKSPNLSVGITEFLMTNGVPVKFLTNFRDVLAHQQLFPLMDVKRETIEEVLDKGLLPMKENVIKKIIEIEDEYIRSIAKENDLDSFLESEGTKKDDLLAKRIVQSYKNLGESKTANLDTLYQNARRMRSAKFNNKIAGEGRPRNPETYMINFIMERKLKLYDDLYKELKSWNDDPKWEWPKKLEVHDKLLKWDHECVMEMVSAVDQLNYGGSEEFFKIFLKSEKLKEITFKNSKREEVRLKEEVEKYLDPAEIGLKLDFAPPRGVKQENVIKLINKKDGSEESKRLIEFIKYLYNAEGTIEPLTPDSYKKLVERLEFEKPEEATLLSFSVDWKKKECVKLLKGTLKEYTPKLKELYECIIKGNWKKIKKDFETALPLVKKLYERRLIEEVKVLENVKNVDAVKSQIINVYSLLNNAQEGPKEATEGDEAKGQDETSDVAQLAEGKQEISKFRNYLSHGDTLTSESQQEVLDKEMVKVKDEVVRELNEKLKNEKIDMKGVGDIIDGIRSNEGIGRIKTILCPLNPRRRIARKIEGCLTWEDIEKVVKGELESIDPDTMKIDSEKLISVLSSNLEINEEKFRNYIALAAETEVEGNLKNEVNGLVEHHKTYTMHLEKVGKFSGVVMHGMIAKDIVGNLMKGDFEGVAIDLTFLGGGVVLGKAAEFASVRGAGYLLKGNALVGKSLKVASPFLSRGLSVFIAYDLWNQVKAMNAGDKDAIVSVVGDSIMLIADSAELLVEVAEGLSLIEGVSATTGPIGMAIGAAVFVGVEIYKSVRAVQKIDKKIHLTGWERFVQGVRAFVGVNNSAYLDALIEEKDGNNAAVQKAIMLLKENPQLLRYIFPSCVHVDGKLVSALNSVVRLNSKVNNIMWTRTRPDDVAGVNLFCKPKGDWETVPRAGTYHCENAIGVEYTTGRTEDYTLINLGEGNDWVEGFPDSGNIFLIDQANKTLFGGSKDDNFIFNRKFNDRTHMVGFIDGQDGLDTINAGGLSLEHELKTKAAQVIVDFPAKTLKYSDNAIFNINRINKYVGIPGVRDIVVLSACDTKFVDGKEGYDEYSPDIYKIKNDDTCVYNTAIVVGSSTEVMNSADTGEFKYFIHGEKRKKSHIFMKPKSGTNNSFTFKYSLGDVGAIDRSQKNSIQLSFVPNLYRTFDNIAADNSFNLTIKGNGEKDQYFLMDNTKLIMGEKNVYALQNTEKAIDDIVEEYTNVMTNLDMYAVVHSHNDVLTITGRHNDVVSNDPTARTSHFVGGAGENIFAFTTGQEKLTMDKLPINESIIHYFNKHNAVDLLDFREIKKQVKNDLGKDVKVEISRVDDDLIIILFVDEASKRKLTQITLRDVLEYLWYRKIRIVMEAVFMIEETQGNFRLVPSPLIFNDKSDTLFVINPRDVVEEMTIKVGKELRAYDFVRNDDSLIITNSLRPNAFENPISTLTLNDFYNPIYKNKMISLTVEFADKTFQLSKETRRINEAQDFDKLRKEVMVETYKGILTAMKRNQPLFEAINQSKIEEAKKIVDNDTNIVSSKDKWMNPLAYAAAKGELEIVMHLVSKGADCKAKDSSGHIPAYYSVRYRHENITNFFLPLLFAQGDEGMIAMTSELAVVKFLNEIKGANYTVTSMVHRPSTLLHYAAMNGNLDVVKYIMEKGKEELEGNLRREDRFEQTPFYYAVKNRHGEVVSYMAETMKKEGTTPLCFAAEIGKLEIVKYLVEERSADIYEKDGFGATPLHYAYRNEHRDVIEYLRQTIVKEGEGQLLVYAIISNDIDTMGSLIREKASITGMNIHGKSPLHYAVNQGNLDMVKLLIESGADMNQKDRSGRAPLYYAHVKRDPVVRQYLRGIVLRLIFPEGSIPAAALADEGFLSFFTENHVPPSVFSSRKEYIMHLIKYLLEKEKVNPSVKNNKNQSPLHYAAQYGDMNIVKYFVHHGADLFLLDEKGRFPADYAATTNHKEIEKYLRDIMYDKYMKDYELRKKVEEIEKIKRGPRSIARKICDTERRQGSIEKQFNSIGSGGIVPGLNDIPGIGHSPAGNDIFSSVKSTIGGLLGQKAESPTHNQFSQVDPHIDANGTIMLLDLLIRKATGKKGVSTFERVESQLEVQGYALRVVETFERVLNETVLELGLSVEKIHFDPLALQSAVIKHKRCGKSSEIPKTLYSFAKEASVGFDQADEFLKHFMSSLEQTLS